MAAAVAEDLDHEVGEAVHDPRLLAEAGRRVDHAEHLDDLADLVQAAEGGAGDVEQPDAGLARGLVALLDGVLLAALAVPLATAGQAGAVAGQIEQVAGADPAHERAVAALDRRQLDVEALEQRLVLR